MVLTRPVPTFGPGGSFNISLHLLQVILAMPRHQQEELTSTVMDAFKRDFSGEVEDHFQVNLSADPAALIQMAMADNAIQGALLTCVVTYLRLASKCRLSIFPSILFRGQGLQVKGA